MLSPRAAFLAASLPCLPLAAAPQQQASALREVAAMQCRGGCFRATSITADRKRVLSIGECGDLILWDLREGRELRRFAPAPAPLAWGTVHPTDPWAVLLTQGETGGTWRLDFGSGRYHRLWAEDVHAFAFDTGGTRAAVLFATDAGSRLEVYAEAALRANRTSPPDFTGALRRAREVHFHPSDPAVLVSTSRGQTWLVPFDGSKSTRVLDGWRGDLVDGSPVLPANDAPVVEPDDRGGLVLCDPAPGAPRVLRGHLGPALQLCFDATNRHLAAAAAGAVNVLELATGRCMHVDGTFGLQAATGQAAFWLLGEDGVRRLDPARGGAGELVEPLRTRIRVETFQRYWTDEPRVSPWLWQPNDGRLWLGNAATSDPFAVPMRLSGRAAPLVLERPRRDQDCPSQDPVAMLAGADGDVLFAETSPPPQCSCCGLEEPTHWSTVRRFAADGRHLNARPLPHGTPWLAVSPRGTRVVVPQGDKLLLLDASDLHTVEELEPKAAIVAFAFVDEDSALATDGTRLLHFVSEGRFEPVALPALPGPITNLCLSTDGALLALACREEVRVFRRR